MMSVLKFPLQMLSERNPLRLVRGGFRPMWIGLALLLALSSGCAYRMEALSQKLADQQRQIGILQRENIEIKSRLEEQKTNSFLLDKRVKENNDRLGEIQARLQSLEVGLGEIKGTLEEMRVSSGRVPTAPAPSAAAPIAPLPGAAAPEAAPSAPELSAAAPGVKPSPEMISPPPPGPLGSEELYNKAMKFLKAGEAGQAILEFEKYVREFPHSELADNAQYWIGEAYYVRKEFSRALAEFQKVLTNFPRGDKVPDALYKMGLSYLEMGQKEKAKAELRKLISRYPGSAPASLARKKMTELSK